MCVVENINVLYQTLMYVICISKFENKVSKDIELWFSIFGNQKKRRRYH